MTAQTRPARGRRAAGVRAVVATLGLAVPLLAAAPAFADFYQGASAFQQQDFETAWLELGPLAESGDPRAQLLVGQMYAQGLGTRPDSVQAYKWVSIAAASGEPQATGFRDALASRMSPDEMAAAQQLVVQWQPQPQPQPGAAYGGYQDQGPIDLSPAPGGQQYAQSQGWTPPWQSGAPATGTQPYGTQPYGTQTYGTQNYGNEPYGTPSYGEPAGGLLNPTEIVELQRALAARGYYGGALDGRVGAGTQAAIRRYQMDAGLPADGLPTAALLDQLRYSQPGYGQGGYPQAGYPQPGYPQGGAFSPGTVGRTQPLGHVEGAMPDLSYAFIQEVQVELMKHGFNPGPVDGLLGQRTRVAVRRYQARAGLPVDGQITLDLLNHLKFVRPPVYAD